MLQLPDVPVPAPAVVDHGKELIGLATVVLLQISRWIADTRKGARRDTAGAKKINAIESGVAQLGVELRDLKAHVIGPDGENGLRSDVRELKSDVRALRDDVRLLERHRTPSVGSYTPRAI